MQIKVTNRKGLYKSFNGDIEYHDSYILIRYIPTVDVTDRWIEIVIPWSVINEVEVKP